MKPIAVFHYADSTFETVDNAYELYSISRFQLPRAFAQVIVFWHIQDALDVLVIRLVKAP